MTRETSLGGAGETFPETVGSLIGQIRDGGSVGRKSALNRFFLLYWRPVYAFLRRRAFAVEDAKDLTQDFLIELLERGSLSNYDPGRGRLRAWLHGALDKFVASRRRANGTRHPAVFSLPPSRIAEIETSAFAADLRRFDAEEMFDRAFAHEVVARALRTLQRELQSEDRGAWYEALVAYDFPDPGERPSYESVAARLKLSAPEVRKHLEYARRRLDAALRRIVTEIAGSAEEVEEELKLLHRA